MTDDFLKNQLEFFTSKEGKRAVSSFVRKMVASCNFQKRWVEKLHNLSIEERSRWIEAMMRKYSSNEYRDRWFKRGYEAPERLCDILFKYGEQYGVESTSSKPSKYFPECGYIIDGKYYIGIMIGQGTAYIYEKV